MGPLINERAVAAMGRGPPGRAGTGRRGPPRRGPARPARVLRRAGGRPRPARDGDRPRGDVRPDPLRDDLRGPRRGDRRPQRGRPGADLGHLHQRPAGGRAVPLGRGLGLRDRQRQHRAPRAPRSAARSAARRPPAAAARRARTRGRRTCVARPARSTAATPSPWPRAFTSTSKPPEHGRSDPPRPDRGRTARDASFSAEGAAGISISAAAVRPSSWLRCSRKPEPGERVKLARESLLELLRLSGWGARLRDPGQGIAEGPTEVSKPRPQPPRCPLDCSIYFLRIPL